MHAASTALPWYAAARAAAGYGIGLSNEGGCDTIHGAIAAAAAAQPDAPAVLSLHSDGGPARVALSHAQLQHASSALAAALSPAAGCGELRCAAVVLDGTPSRLVAYLAVLRAGLAYAPVEAQLPPATLRSALAAAAPRVVLTSQRLLATLRDVLPRCAATLVLDDHTGALLQQLPWAEQPAEAPDEGSAGRYGDCSDGVVLAAGHNVAHVSFTSGSTTGVPRLLACSHGGSLQSHAWRATLCAHRPRDVTALAVFGIWDAAAALLAGGAVVALSDATVRDGGALARALLRCDAARLMLTPALAAALLADAAGAAALRRLKLLTLCGEPPGAPLLAALRKALPASATLLNLYSTAEAHDVAAARVGPDCNADGDADAVTCGFVAPFAAVHILKPKAAPPESARDDEGEEGERELCAVGELGEVWLGGAALADGHLSGGRVVPLAPGTGFCRLRVAGLPHVSGEVNGTRLFSTGDLGRLRADGRLQVVGRAAGVTKLKLAGGATADACSIEAALLQRCPGVAAAAVAARDGVLAAFLVAKAVSNIDDVMASLMEARAVREALRCAVPDCALPQHVVWLPRLPLGPTGKLDRAALPWPTQDNEGVGDRGGLSSAAASQAQDGDEDALATALALFAEAADRAGAPPLSRARGAATHFLLDAGGTSVAAAAMLTAAADAQEAAVFAPLSLPEFLANPTAGALAAMLRRRRDGAAATAARAAADAAEAELARRDAEELPLSADETELPARRCDAPRDVIVLTGAAGAIGAHVLAALISLLDTPTVVVCLVRAADDATALARLRAAAEAHGLPDPLHSHPSAAGVSVEARRADLTAPYVGLAGGAAAYAELACRTRVVLHAAGRVSLAAPYDGQLRADNVIATAAALRLACAARADAHVVSSSAALAGAAGDDVAAPPGRAPPAGGYGRAKWAAERLVQRCAQASVGGVPKLYIHRVGYLGPASLHGTPDAQATVLAACAALCAAPHAPQWRLAWASVPRFAAALARAAAASAATVPDAVPDAALRVVHHAAEASMPFAAALAALRERGLPTTTLPPAAWDAAVRGAARDGVPAAQRCAALLDAVGLEAACGALDVHLQHSAWPSFITAAEKTSSLNVVNGEGAAVLDAVLEALRWQGMVPAR